MQQTKNLKIILIVIGIILIFSSIRSIYITYNSSKDYKITNAICIRENKFHQKESIYYKRDYIYTVSGQEYTLFNITEYNSKPYKMVKYKPNNPSEASTYNGITIEIIIFFIGLTLIFSPFLYLHAKNNKKLQQIKNKLLYISKRNSMKIINICFVGYIVLSIISVLKEIFCTPDWYQVVNQYSSFEIIIECIVFILARCSFKKFTTYFNIFRYKIWYQKI